MCGILGDYSVVNDEARKTRIKAGLEALSHRGPDDNGLEHFLLSNGVLSLGHTRLSIIDLSSGGHQPMNDIKGRYTIIFNGEIYNYKELRKELQSNGYKFSTASDTEVLLNSWIVWGEKCLNRLVGMFAFALFDRAEEKLICARDAFGIKPFFYHINNIEFQFSSEVMALKQLNVKEPEIDYQTAHDFLVHGVYDIKESTFLKGVKRLLPGHIMELDFSSTKLDSRLNQVEPFGAKVKRWWWPKVKERTDLTFEQAAEKLREIFLRSVDMHLKK